MAECEERGEESRGQAWLVGLLSENFGGQACVIVVIGVLGCECFVKNF